MSESKRRSENESRDDDWAYRGIGAFCGFILGACLAAVVILAVGVGSVPAGLAILGVAMLLGAVVGYRFPAASDAILWIVSLFT